MIKLVVDPWDRQQDEPFTYCAECGGEIYEGEECYRIGGRYFCDNCVMKEVAGE